jgi:hypothetical protein
VWNDSVRLNDKALTIVTGLVLLLGVGTLAHKGDEFFAPKADHVEIAKADLSISDAPHNTYDFAPTQLPRPISTPVKIAPTVISDFKLVRSETTLPKAEIGNISNGANDQPIVLDCDLNLDAKSLRGARVLLEISAPCHKREIVLISHAGLRFNEIIGELGMISIIIPVLSDPANIEVSFADGVTKSISAPAKDLSTLQRTGIAWSGQSDLQLHADEHSFDASRNTQITSLAPRSYMQSYLQGGGYIITLGNKDIKSGHFVQMYSIESPSDIFVDFKVAIEHSNNRCGSPITVKTINQTAYLATQIVDKSVLLRNCSANNETIVLNNFLRNLKVAQRN